MPKKLSLTDLNINSFVTTENASFKGGITGGNTWCKSNQHNPCGESFDYCSELYTACGCQNSNGKYACEIKTVEKR